MLTLDLLMQINGRPPVWISLRSEQGYRVSLGPVPALRVRAKTPFNDVLGVRKGTPSCLHTMIASKECL
jgi:hypothetical protein